MKKLWLLLLFTFLITGCDATYKIEIYNDTVTEKVTPWYNSSEVSGDIYEYTRELSQKYDDNGDFLTHDSKKNVKNKNQIGIELTNKYKGIEDFKDNSKIINYCYIAQNITQYEKDSITLKTSQEFTCFNEIEELENVTIAIKSNHKLKETNADKIKGHTYYWYINKENYQNKPISLILYSDKHVWNYDNEILKRLGLIILVIGGTVLVAFSSYKIYKKKEEEF